jgi:hypothetical protein
MSKRSRTLKKVRRTADGRPVTKVRTPGDILAVVPYLLGFDPVESIVVIALRGPRKQFGPVLRIDLPAVEHVDAVADYLGDTVSRHRFETLVVVLFSATSEVADPMAAAALDRLEGLGVDVVDAFRGDGRRWWSYVCTDPLCCDPAGTTYDANSTAAAASAVLAGMTKLPDRDALRAQFEPADPAERMALDTTIETLAMLGVDRLGRQALEEVVSVALRGSRPLSRQEQAQLLVTITEIPRRDQIWGQMRRSNAERHFDAWRPLMQLAPDDLVAPIGSLTAFAAWLCGRGVLASHAVERVLELSPEYSMARLIRTTLEGSLSPAAWTPEVWREAW